MGESGSGKRDHCLFRHYLVDKEHKQHCHDQEHQGAKLHERTQLHHSTILRTHSKVVSHIVIAGSECWRRRRRISKRGQRSKQWEMAWTNQPELCRIERQEDGKGEKLPHCQSDRLAGGGVALVLLREHRDGPSCPRQLH